MSRLGACLVIQYWASNTDHTFNALPPVYVPLQTNAALSPTLGKRRRRYNTMLDGFSSLSDTEDEEPAAARQKTAPHQGKVRPQQEHLVAESQMHHTNCPLQ